MKPSSSLLTLLIGLLTLSSLTACFPLGGKITNAHQFNTKLNPQPKSNANPVSLFSEQRNNLKPELGSELLPIAFYLNSRNATSNVRPGIQENVLLRHAK